MARRTIVLVVALLLAAIAAFAVWQFLTNVEEDAAADFEPVTVYRAADFIGEGLEGDLILSQGRAVESEENRKYLPTNAVTSEDQLTLALSGKVAAGPISANSVLTSDQWVELTVDVKPLAESIPEGKQAITISLDEERGVNGFVQPGDRVNVIVTIDVDVTNGSATVVTAGDDFTGEGATTTQEETTESVTVTRFVLQGLPVLAVGRDIRPDEEVETVEVVDPTATEDDAAEQPTGLGALTVEVTPEQAERLAHAFEEGRTWLTLVPADFVEVATEGITIENLFGDDVGILDDLFDSDG